MNKIALIVILVVISFVVGMLSPGQWLTDRSWELKQLYNNQFRFRSAPVAEGFVANPFGLKVVYLKNEKTGKIETYLTNTKTNEAPLPILEVAQTTQLGDFEYRLKSVREDAQKKLEKGGKTALEKLKQIQDLLKF